MQHTRGEGIEEVFIVQTEGVDFLATLVRLDEYRVLANGRVLFEDGNRSFSRRRRRFWVLPGYQGR